MKSKFSFWQFIFSDSLSKRIILLLAFNCLFLRLVWGQGQANVWYTGNGAGLDFNTVPPTKLQNGNAGLMTFTGEGVGSMSDANGNLLFYTNGSTVYDNTHTAMPNGTGLYGNGTTEQTGTIVPKIGSSNQYYIISPADIDSATKYSIVDMTLHGGLGDVVASSKNTTLKLHASESCLVIPHSNGTDFWVVLHASTVNTYHVFLFTASGITGPTNYSVGGSGQATMQMKVNSCFNQIASVFYNQTRVEVVSFNNSTGVVSSSGMKTITNFLNPEVYGGEFSPSGRFLYVSESGLNGRKTIYQFDLQAGNDAAINASRRYYTGDATIIRMGTLQLGPDAKIYIPGYTTVAPSYMSVVPTPDVQWVTSPPTSSEFQYLKYTFNVKRVGEGLPPIIRTLLTSVKIVYSNACEGGSTNLSFVFGSNASGAAGAISWNFGDGATATDIAAPTHTYSTAGTYTVTVTVTDLCGNTRIGSGSVIIKAGPQVSVPSPRCPNTNIILHGTGSNAANYSWSNNSNGSPVIGSGTNYTYNGTLAKTIYVQDPTPLATYTTGNPINPPNGNAGADVGYTYFELYQTATITSFQIYSRASGAANLSLQNEAGTTTYWGPTACNPSAASQTFTFTPNVSLAAGRYRLYTSLKTPFFRENNSVDGGRNVNNVIDVLGEKSGTKGGSFLNIIVALPDPCGIRTYVLTNNCGIAQSVQLISFNAIKVDSKIVIKWATASEFNSAYFKVEKSTDGKTYSQIARIEAAGTSTETLNYAATDDYPQPETNYYRLAMYDINGTVSYSNIETVQLLQSIGQLAILPNPATDQSLIYCSSFTDQPATITVMNMMGHIMLQQQVPLLAGFNSKQVDLSSLPQGVYGLQLTSGACSQSVRFVR